MRIYGCPYLNCCREIFCLFWRRYDKRTSCKINGDLYKHKIARSSIVAYRAAIKIYSVSPHNVLVVRKSRKSRKSIEFQKYLNNYSRSDYACVICYATIYVNVDDRELRTNTGTGNVGFSGLSIIHVWFPKFQTIGLNTFVSTAYRYTLSTSAQSCSLP